MYLKLYAGLYFIIINIIAFLLMGADKKRAREHEWRIPEKTLFLIAWLGGSIGSICGMRTFRHKTKHTRFCVGMPLIFLLQLFIIRIACYALGKTG